jgi:hypothetical protein
MTPRDGIGLTLVLGVGGYLWIWHPAVMAAVLLVGLVTGMLTLAVLAMLRWDRRRVAETREQRVLRIVNEREPVTHWWR